MASPAAEKLYTAEEFFEFASLPENEDKFWELEDGVIIEMPSPSMDHSDIASEIATRLRVYAKEHDLGKGFTDGTGYILGPNRVRVPDASFISKDRLTKPLSDFRGAPDLAVEVASPSETPTAVANKAALYINSGARLVWYVFPAEKIVQVYRPAERGVNVETLDINGTLDGGEVLPNFALEVRKVFEG